MAERNLPIKVVRKRENDQLLNEASGGASAPPRWVLSGEQMGRRVSEFQTAFTKVSSRLSEKTVREDFQPVLLRVRLHEEATAKSHRKEIAALFNTQQKLNLIGMVGENHLIVKIDSAADLQLIEARLQNTEKYAVALSGVEDPDLFKPLLDVAATHDGAAVKVKLFHFRDYEQNQVLLRGFELFCAANGLECRRLQYSNDLNIFEVSGLTTDGLDDLQEFDGIFSVTEMPSFTVVPDSVELDAAVELAQPLTGVDYPVVGVLDTGIATGPCFDAWKIPKRHTNFPEEDIDPRHGSMVAGVLLYGDQLEGVALTGTAGCRVMDAVVYPATTTAFSEVLLIDNVREAIRKNHREVKIWNLSLGTAQEADLYDFSDFAKALDSIQEEYGVLIIKSAGNCKNYRVGKPKSRIANSADSVRSLVVGSIAYRQAEFDLALPGYPSPFTRTGPGPGGLIKPDLVHVGGNTGFKNAIEITSGVKTLSTAGTVTAATGTSFATPRVAALSAGITGRLREEFNPLLIKGLLVHSAQHPELAMAVNEKIDQTGYGCPSALNEILFNDPDEVTLIFQDAIEKGSYVKIMDFPYPACLTEDGYFYGQVIITLVTAPLLDSNQGAEYCQSDVDVKFGSYDEKTQRDLALRNIRNPVGTEGNQNLLVGSNFSQRKLKQVDNPFNRERILINHGKYQPIKKWVIDLDELTDGNREKFLKAPKMWFLELRATFRENVEALLTRQRQDPTVDFALLITIRDSRRRGQVYNQVTQLLDQHNFIHSNIRLREEARIQLEG